MTLFPAVTSEGDSVAFLAAFLNSVLFKCCFKDNFPELMGNTYEVRKIFIDILPVKKPTKTETELFEKLVPLVQAAKKVELSVEASVLESLIDACVMECYFREHMAERDLLFHDSVTEALSDFNPEADADRQVQYIEALHSRLQATVLPQKLKAIPGKSPDLLAVILKEGKV